MPELPEIETVKKTLSPLVIGRTLSAVQVLQPSVIKHPQAAEFAHLLEQRSIETLGRRGKYLLLHLENGFTLVVHLRMTGRLVCVPADTLQRPHTHVIISLDNGMELRFSDTRRFGCLWLLAPGEEDDFTGMARLGIEPLSKDLSAHYLEEKLGHRKIAVKSGILNQHILAGLGNIYADEVLFFAGVHPARPCQSLSSEEWAQVAAAIPPVLEQAIANNGTTFSDFLDGAGEQGKNMPHLSIYGRAGQPCLQCQAAIEKIRLGGRGTCFCPQCQT